MHFLLIPYTSLCLVFLVHYQSRNLGASQVGMVITTVATGVMLFLAMMFRPVSGDSWRYYQTFKDLSTLDLRAALHYPDRDVLFSALNWVAGQLGSAPWLLFGASLLVFTLALLKGLRQLLSPIEVAAVFMCYSMFPFAIAYEASGMRQGLAMAFMLVALGGFYRRKKSAWIWLLIAPLWHNGAWLAVAVIAAHHLLFRITRSPRLRWGVVATLLIAGTLLSATGTNRVLMRQAEGLINLKSSQTIYFDEASQYGYRAGFRPDFLLFSLVPLLTAWGLRKKGKPFDDEGIGWWLSIYLSLNVIYQLFSFAPFSDRFAAFSWFLMPLVIYLQVQATRDSHLQRNFIATVMLVNIAMLQLYTGYFIKPPKGWG